MLWNSKLCYAPALPLWGLSVVEWNLAWLSVPRLETMSGQLTVALAQQIGTLALTLKDCRSEGVPEWPYLLTLEPAEFLDGFEESNWSATTAGILIGPAWLGVVRHQVELAHSQPLAMRPYVLARDGDHALAIPLPRFAGVAG